MLSLSRRSLRPSVLPCCSADDQDIAPCGAANTKTRARRELSANSRPAWLECTQTTAASERPPSRRGTPARIAKVSPRRAAPGSGCDVFAQFCGSRVGGIDACRLPSPAIGLPSFDGISRPLAVVAAGETGRCRCGCVNPVAMRSACCCRRCPRLGHRMPRNRWPCWTTWNSASKLPSMSG